MGFFKTHLVYSEVWSCALACTGPIKDLVLVIPREAYRDEMAQ